MAQGFIVDVNLRIQQVLGLEKVKQQLANIQVGGIGRVNQLSDSLKSVGINASSAVINIAKGAKATVNLGNSARSTGNDLGKATKKVKGFGDQVFLAGKRYAAFLGATVVAFKAFQLISAGTKSVIEFDQAMVSLSQIIGVSRSELSGLSQQFLDLSITTGTSAAEIANAAKLLAQAGFRGRELTEAVESLSKIPLTPIFDSMEQSVDGAIAVMRQFSNEGLTVEQVFDKIIKVSNRFAASSPEIVEGFKRGGSAFQLIGGTVDEFIAAFTTIRSVTRESASAVGTSIKTISSRLADPKILAFLETKGIRLIEEGQFVGPLEALKRIGEGLENTKNLQDKVNIAVKLGGRRQVSRFAALAQNMDKTNEILEVSKNSFGELDKVAKQGLQSIGKQIDILVNKSKKLAIDLGEDLFIPFIKGLTSAAEGAIVLFDVLKPILPIVTQIGVALAGFALLKGIGSFIGPKLAQLAGPAAFSAIGGGRKGVTAGVMASPFAQAGLLIAASAAASALFKTADGATSLTGSIITSVAGITAAITLFKSQTIAQFATGGGLFPSLGKLGKLGALAGSAATIGVFALPAIFSKVNQSSQELIEKIIKSSVESIAKIEIEPSDPKSLSKGLGNLYENISKSVQELISSVDMFENPSISKSLTGISNAFGNLFEGDFEGIIRRGGLSRKDIDEHVKKIIDKSPKLIKNLIDNIASSLVIDGKINARTIPFDPSGKQTSLQRGKLIQQIGISEKIGFQEASLFADVIIDAVGGIEEWNASVLKSSKTIQKEIVEREKLVKLTSNFIPSKLVGQLFQFSKAVDKTTRTINVSAKLFETQIAEIAGGISVSTFDFDFAPKQVENLVRSGGLKELFSSTPDIQRFIGVFGEIEDLLDNFVINISNLPVADLNLADEIDKFFEFQKNVPQTVRDNFEDFFNIIAEDIALVSEGKFISPDDIKERFKKEFEGLGIGTTDAVVESITDFMNATFIQIEDELNRLATIRQFELDVAVRPKTQEAFLEQQLRRVGISAGGARQQGGPRGTIEELDLLRREREARGGISRTPGLLTAPPVGFFEGREQGLVDIVGDERIRKQVRDSFRGIILESSALKKKLAELKPGAEGFIEASNRAKELARSTIELQTTLEALDRATQQVLDSEKRTLTLRQQFETSQAQARLAEQVRIGRITPLESERVLFDLAKEQGKEQAALQDKFDTIIEKDNSLRVSLAKEISETTKTQAEIIGNFDISANIFADATRAQATTVDLMRQYVSEFGQSVVDFSNLNGVGQVINQGISENITPAQIRSGGVTIQQAFDGLNKVISEGNVSQEGMNEVLRAIYDRQEQVQPVKQESSAAQKEQEKDTKITDKIGQLNESIDNLRLVLSEPNEIRLVSDQRVELDLSTLPADVVNEVLPILEEAGIAIAKTVTRKAMESLAAKSDSEGRIAATDVAQELA